MLLNAHSTVCDGSNKNTAKGHVIHNGEWLWLLWIPKDAVGLMFSCEYRAEGHFTAFASPS
jgi:hypothetical protein